MTDTNVEDYINNSASCNTIDNTEDVDLVKSFGSSSKALCLMSINAYARTHNLRIVSISGPTEESCSWCSGWSRFSDSYWTAVVLFDKI